MNKYNPLIHHRRSIRLKGYNYAKTGLYFITICCQDRVHRFGHIENGEMQLNEFGRLAYDEWLKLGERFRNFELDVFQIMPNHMHGIISLIDTPVGAGLAPAQKDIDNINERAGASLAPTNSLQEDMDNTFDIKEEAGTSPVLNENKDNCDERAGASPVLNENIDNCDERAGASPAPTAIPTISDIIGAYKSLVSKGCLDICKSKNEIMGKLWQRNYYEHIIRNEHAYHRISAYIINNPAKWSEDKFY